MKMIRRRQAFTLVELMVGLMVTSIILSAVATLAFALSSASRASDDVTYAQTQLRSVTPRIHDLIRRSRMICAQFDDHLVIWRSYNNQDGQIHVNEIVYLEYDDPNDSLRLYEFTTSDNPTVLSALELPNGTPVLTELAKPQTKSTLIQKYLSAGSVRQGAILRNCRNVSFLVDQNPPRTKHLTVAFDLADNGGSHHYEIDATMRVSAAHLLSSDATNLVTDDD